MAKHLTLAQLIANGALIPAISYRRVSSEKQLYGEGLSRQRKGTLEWITKHSELNLRLDAEKEDQARSAWKGDHVKKGSALGSILEQVKEGTLQPPLMIVVEALDRLSRQDVSVATEQLTGLINRGVFVATTRDDQIYGPGMDLAKLILSVVYMAGAHAESESKSHRIHETKLAHVQAALAQSAAGQQPHVIHQNVPMWCVVDEKITTTNRGTRKCRLLEGPAATVLLIYQIGLDHGAEYITRWLIAHQAEHPPFGRTGRWTARTVHKILRSRSPIGQLESRHGIIMDAYPRVPGLTDELWFAVQAAQKERVKAGSKPWKTDKVNLLVGIGQCASCGGKMRLVENDKTHYRYYRCRNRSLLHTCDNSGSYRQDLIEAAMLDRFGLGWLEATPFKGTPASDLPTLAAERDKLREREKRLAAKLQELDDDDIADLVIPQLRELRGKLADTQTRLNTAQQQAEAAQAVVKIGDMTDRAALATALKLRLKVVRFGANNVVEIESTSHILTVVARQDGEKPQLALKHGSKLTTPIHMRQRPEIELLAFGTKAARK